MKITTRKASLAGLFILAVSGLQTLAVAQTITQTNFFTYEGSFSGSGSTNFVAASFFDAAFNPVTDYGASNQLTSFTIAWDVTFSAGGVSSSAGAGGFSTIAAGGSDYSVNGVIYTGNGVGFGGGGAPDAAIATQSDDVKTSNTFTPGDANGAILTAIMTGPELGWDSPYGLNYYNIASGDTTISGSVVLTYVGVPEPATLSLAGWGGLVLLAFRCKKARGISVANPAPAIRPGSFCQATRSKPPA